MKKLIIILMIALFTSGCGVHNLNVFTLPDDIDFFALINELDTPYKICEYMLENFTYELSPYTSKTPYEMYVYKTGDCNDYSTFAMFIAHYHGYETYQIIITFLGDKTKHSIAVYKENKYSFSDNGYYFTGIYNFISFLEIVEYDSYLQGKTWLKYNVYDYEMNILSPCNNI